MFHRCVECSDIIIRLTGTKDPKEHISVEKPRKRVKDPQGDLADGQDELRQ
jgi:hypothetical protein